MTTFFPLFTGRAVSKEESEDACDFNIICHHHCPHCRPRGREISLSDVGSVCHMRGFPGLGARLRPAGCGRGGPAAPRRGRVRLRGLRVTLVLRQGAWASVFPSLLRM